MLKVKFVCALVIFTVSMSASAELVPFLSSGKITAIDTGDVVPAGISGRFVVKERHVEGTLDNGDLGGSFLMTYHA